MQRLKGRLYATTTETGAIFDYDRRTVIAAIEAGNIPAVKAGRDWRIPVSWIVAQPGIPAEFAEGADAAA
jgi:hypothetical protein